MIFLKKKKQVPKYGIYCRVGTYEQVKCEGLKVVIYARSSNRKELKRQIKKLVNYCEKNRFEIVAVKAEVSRGKKYFRFPLNSAMKNKDAEAMVITDLSRFSRDIPLGLQLLSRVYENNKFLIGADCDEIIDSTVDHSLKSGYNYIITSVQEAMDERVYN